MVLLLGCMKNEIESEQCTIVEKWTGSFIQNTGFYGNIYEGTKIKEIFKKNPTFAPVSSWKKDSNIFLRLSKYVGSMGNHEKVEEINYLNDSVIIDFKQSIPELGASVMNQPFILFEFSKGCKNISTTEKN